MFDGQVIPYLLKQSNQTLVSKNINVFGLGESLVEDMLKDLMVNYQNPTIAPYAKDGEVLLRVTASASNEQDAIKLIDPAIDKIIKILGEENIYGIDAGSLQNALVDLLRSKHLSIATAESCTGGLISKRITEVPGSSVVRGV